VDVPKGGKQCKVGNFWPLRLVGRSGSRTFIFKSDFV
jgi:hypothetical protein